MKKQDISLLKIESVIVHDVPKHTKADTSPTVDYSEKQSQLKGELKIFFKDKITEALAGTKSFRVCFDDGTTSPIPSTLNNMITTSNGIFVDSSQKIAKHLYDIQTGQNPSGIVVIMECLVNRKNAIAIMKLERDEGARLKKNTAEHTIDIEGVRDLMLTKRTKVYKVGLLFNRDDFSADFDGYVNDSQASSYGRINVARFFLGEFLGCIMYGDTRILTQQFFDVSVDFITKVEDPIKKAKYFNDLISYINKNTQDVNPREFAIDYLELDDRQVYEEHLKTNDVPIQRIQKNTELIKNKIKKMVMDFDNGISITSIGGEIKDKVKLSKADEGKIKAEFTAKLKRIYS